MRKNTKKKILTVTLVIALLAIAVVGGSLAWFTAEDEATNTFTVGSVKIDLKEEFEAPEAMLPIGDPSTLADDPNYIRKEAWVENTGKNDAYVQILVAVPKELDDLGAFHYVEANTDKWDAVGFIGTTTIDSKDYNVYRYCYNTILASGSKTENVIEAAYLDHQVNYNPETGKFVMNGTETPNYGPESTIDVYVVAQAVQAEGFDTYTAALDSAFGNSIPAFGA